MRTHRQPIGPARYVWPPHKPGVRPSTTDPALPQCKTNKPQMFFWVLKNMYEFPSVSGAGSLLVQSSPPPGGFRGPTVHLPQLTKLNLKHNFHFQPYHTTSHKAQDKVVLASAACLNPLRPHTRLRTSRRPTCSAAPAVRAATAAGLVLLLILLWLPQLPSTNRHPAV